MKLAIADADDNDVDSNVFIEAGSLSSSTLTFNPTSVDFGEINRHERTDVAAGVTPPRLIDHASKQRTKRRYAVVGLVGGATSTITGRHRRYKTNVNMTSGKQPITVMNTGTAAVKIPSIVASAGFGETDNCVGALPASGTCTIQATFTPTTERVHRHNHDE